MDFSWSKEYPDVLKICSIYGLYELSNPKSFNYMQLPELIQDGPFCGLLSLAMFTENPSKDTVMHLLKIAKELGYTYNGEMFSANSLCTLANKFTKYKASTYNGSLNDNHIKDFLKNGGYMLVPYDSDKNHSPCLNNGHSAHWAAISGFVETEYGIFVLAKQGKSKNVAIWLLDSLAESNSQLNEYSPSKKHQNMEFLFPEGGIAGTLGLCNKSVLLR